MGTLNENQMRAVTHDGGPLLVLAGAGTGKTRVITHRIAYLIENGIAPGEICALTFTNKAAGEMRERIDHLLTKHPGAAGKLVMGTFHSLGLMILRREYRAAELPKRFAIYDTADQLGLLREICRRAGLGRRYDLKAILSRISLAKNEGIAPEHYTPGECDDYDEATEVLYPKYQESLRACGAVDFDDLILLPIKIWNDNAQLAERWAAKYRHVLVDEFQDSNRTQLKMIEHLGSRTGNVFAVGDDDQSIYGWRGADPTNILEFDKRMQGATVIRLEENYRSSPVILHMANGLIENNQARLGKTLRTSRNDQEPIVHAVAKNSDDEAEFIADEIETVKRNIGCGYGSFAILYRSNVIAARIEEALRARRIPYQLLGGQQFFERKEVKDVLAYLRVVLLPQDALALRRVINYPARGIGAKTVMKATEISSREEIPLLDAFSLLCDDDESIRPATRKGIESFVETIDWARQHIHSTPLPTMRSLIERIDLAGDVHDASPSASAAQYRMDNVNQLFTAIETYLSKPGERDLVEFVRFLSLGPNDDEDQSHDHDKVTLTTLHSAKGLEFPTVFMVGMEDGILPHSRTLNPTSSDIFDPEKVGDISEERRLCYVGITRAKYRLYLTRSVFRSQRGKRPAPAEPSRFLFELPDDNLVTRDIAEEQQSAVPSDEVRALFKKLAQD